MALLAERRDDIAVPAHALAEAYSVLTRLPPPNRMSGAVALAILDGSWRQRECVALDAEDCWSTLSTMAASGTIGGAVYDGLILAAGQKSGATTLITCNIGHFSRLDVAGIAIMTPSDLISQQ